MNQRLACFVCAVPFSLSSICMPAAAQPSGMRTWTDATGQHKTEAIFIQLREGKVYLEKQDGRVVVVPIERLSAADQALLRNQQQPEPPEASGSTASNVMQIDLSDSNRPRQDTDDSAVRAAIVTGVGLDPEKALQAAFSQAIEQTVGVLVDSETLVENDAIIRDKVLTVSRAYVQDYDTRRQWQEDGLYRAKIRAFVKADQLAVSLEKHGVAVSRFAGKKMGMQITANVESEADAAEMLIEIAKDCSMDKLLKVTFEGEPEVVERDAVQVKLRRKILLTADVEHWRTVHGRMTSVLKQVADKSASFQVQPSRQWDSWYTFFVNEEHVQLVAKQLMGGGCAVPSNGLRPPYCRCGPRLGARWIPSTTEVEIVSRPSGSNTRRLGGDAGPIVSTLRATA